MSLEEIFKSLERKRAEIPQMSPPEWIICGLGNPGKQYEASRHNAGFATLDLFAAKYGFKIDRLRFKALTAQYMLPVGGEEKRSVLFIKPQTFMNNSGEAVGEASRFYKIEPSKIIIICDDVSLTPGSLRIRPKGSDGGHNGLKSIIYHLSSDAFPRIKLGVGSPDNSEYDMAAWVLGAPEECDRKLVYEAAKSALPAAAEIIGAGWDKAASHFNRTQRREAPGARREND